MKRLTIVLLSLSVVLGLLAWQMRRLAHPTHETSTHARASSLILYCAAGLRSPVEQIVHAYEQEMGVRVEVQYGGSHTLLNQLEVAQTGDLFLAAEESYVALGQQKHLLAEEFPLAYQFPAILVASGNPKGIQHVSDLFRDEIKTALGNPDQAAIGKLTRQLLTKTGEWPQLEQHVTRRGVFHPTVPEVANDVKLGTVDAGIVWDSTARMMKELDVVHPPELQAGRSTVTLAITQCSQQPTAALQFARYVAAQDRGLATFSAQGFEVLEGDVWDPHPKLTFYCGTVNRRAVEPVLREFRMREGIEINTVFNGCGILTAQMNTIRQQQSALGFPDTYMACDRYYLETVRDWFQEDADLSDTEVVIVVPRGNPRGIHGLSDLTAAGLRITVGQPDQCTIGVLTRRVLQSANLEAQIMPNVVQETASSALLIPSVITGAADAALAYATDALAEGDKIEFIPVNQPAAHAIQPFAIAKSSRHKQLARRLYRSLVSSRAAFENAGFHFCAQATTDTADSGSEPGSPQPHATESAQPTQEPHRS